MTPTIRPPRNSDAEAMAAMISDLGYPLTAETVLERMRGLERVGAAVLVAEVEGCPAACCSLSVTHVLHRPAPVGRISMMVVDHAYRGQGIGAKLVAAAEEELRRRGCAMIEVTSGNSREGAHRFYERLGFDRSAFRFAKKPPGER